MSVDRFHKFILAAAIVVYSVAAINTKGYYHFDEHYQIIEFAGLKLESNQPSDLAWEYKARIRPAFQPAIAFVVVRLFESVGWKDAYTQASALRMLTMVLALAAIRCFVRSFISTVPPACQRAFILMSYFLWFLPYLNVRFSSEAWSGILFLWAVALISRRKQLMVIGCLLGLSFICRFQSAILIAALYAWLMVVHNTSIRQMLFITSGIALMVLLGIAIDYWFYGELVFTPLNYFRVNILQDAASAFGTAPWHFYIKRLWVIPGAILLVAALLIVVVRHPFHLLTWLLPLFFLVHCLIAHKETRFLFPLINFTPLLLILAWADISRHLQVYDAKLWRPPVYVFVGALLLINLVGLADTTLTSAANGTKAITHYIHKKYRGKALNLIYSPYADPYNPINYLDLPETFYKDENIREISFEDALTHGDTAILAARNNLWVIQKTLSTDPQFVLLKQRYGMQLITQSIPPWAQWIESWYNEGDNGDILLLYGKGAE